MAEKKYPQPKARRVPSREWTEVALSPVIAQFEAPVHVADEAKLAEVTQMLEQIGDGGLIAQGTLSAGTWSGTWSVTGSLPPDADGDLDG